MPPTTPQHLLAVAMRQAVMMLQCLSDDVCGILTHPLTLAGGMAAGLAMMVVLAMRFHHPHHRYISRH